MLPPKHRRIVVKVLRTGARIIFVRHDRSFRAERIFFVRGAGHQYCHGPNGKIDRPKQPPLRRIPCRGRHLIPDVGRYRALRFGVDRYDEESNNQPRILLCSTRMRKVLTGRESRTNSAWILIRENMENRSGRESGSRATYRAAKIGWTEPWLQGPATWVARPPKTAWTKRPLFPQEQTWRGMSAETWRGHGNSGHSDLELRSNGPRRGSGASGRALPGQLALFPGATVL